jgi:hypothetical protein
MEPGQQAKKIYITFDEWLLNRLGMTEQALRQKLEKNLPYYHYRLEYPDAVIAQYKKKRQEEMDIIASEGIDLTFVEWLQVFEHHTPESFHCMCAGTGISTKEEKLFMDYLKKKWTQRRNALLTDKCPFEN